MEEWMSHRFLRRKYMNPGLVCQWNFAHRPGAGRLYGGCDPFFLQLRNIENYGY
jgi:hypothetical protein